MMRKKAFLVTGILVLLLATMPGTGGSVLAQMPAITARVKLVSATDLAPLEAEPQGLTKATIRKAPANVVKAISLAVDEAGNLYLAFSLHTAPSASEPRLIKYDSTGRFLSSFELPPVVRSGALAFLSSVTLSQSKVYVPVSWKDDAGNGKGAILIFTKEGELENMVELPPGFSPHKVVVTATSQLYVLGSGPRLVNGQYVYPASDMILKLSDSGRVLASFSPFPAKRREEIIGLLSRMRQNDLLLNSAGRLVHILPDATIRVFDLNGRLQKTIKPALRPFDFLDAAFLRDDLMVLATTELAAQRTYLSVVDQEGRVISQIDTSDKPSIRVEGQDGYYYSVSYLPLRGPEGVRIRISKARLELVK